MTDCYQCMEFGFDPDCHCQFDSDPVYGTKHLTDRYKRGEHVMNSNEAKVMRRLQSETGLSEEEIRTHKKYRKMLSEAQKEQGPGMTDNQRGAKRVLKTITRELKLAKQHPDVVAAAMKAAKDYRPGWYGGPTDISQEMKALLEA